MTGLNPSELSGQPSFEYITYSYKEGISSAFMIIILALMFALINMIISLIVGIRRKDCLSILIVNVIVKTVTLSLDLILCKMFYLDNLLIFIVSFFIAIIIEGHILKKVLKYKKHNGMTVSIICNIGATVIVILLDFIFHINLEILLNSLF